MADYAEHRVESENRTYVFSRHDNQEGWWEIVAHHDDDEPGMPSRFWEFGTRETADAAWSLVTRA